MSTRGARFVAAWDQFWFAPVDPRSLGLMRITLGLILLGNHLLLAPELERALGPDGYFPLSTAIADGARERWSFFDHLPDTDALWVAWGLGALPMIGMIAGFQTRLMTLLTLLVEVAVHHRNPWIQHGGDRVLRINTWMMLLAPAGAAWSVDAWWARRRALRQGQPPPTPTATMWTHRLIQLQLVVIYMATGVLKHKGSTWQAGTALYYALLSQNFQRLPALTDAVMRSPIAYAATALGTWVTLGWELGFGLLLLWPRTRWLALGLGIALHLGILSTMMVGAFSPAMLWCYQAFFTVPLLLWRPAIRRAMGLPR